MELVELRQSLEIDPDDLDTGLVKQPDLFFNVAEAFATAVSRRDEAKLKLEELQAHLDQDIRRKATAEDRKLTEGSIANQLRDMPRVQEAERALLKARLDADMWQALKEAFQQRSFMLRELVSLKVRQLDTLSLENGSASGRRALADAAERRAAASRPPGRLRYKAQPGA